MKHQVKPGSIAFQVVIFFARHPDEELTSLDVAEKFGASVEAVGTMLRYHVASEMLGLTRTLGGRGKAGTYRAGQRLLEMIGETASQAAPPERTKARVLTVMTAPSLSCED